jgi:hypothetical protein
MTVDGFVGAKELSTRDVQVIYLGERPAFLEKHSCRNGTT